MFRWLLRIGFGLLATKLAQEYMQPSGRKPGKRTASRSTAKRGKSA
jgi:hypothetical protein